MPNKEVNKQNPESDSINEPNLNQGSPDVEAGSPQTMLDPETPQSNQIDKKDELNFDSPKVVPF